MNASRRQIFAFIPIGLAMLAGCNGTPGAAITTAITIGPQLVADVQGIAAKLAATFPALQGVTSSDVWAKVQVLLPQLGTAASALNATLTQDAAKPFVTKAVDILTQIAGIAGPWIPQPWGLMVQGAVALIPLIQAGVGLLTNTAPAAGGMAPAQARQLLGIPTVA